MIDEYVDVGYLFIIHYRFTKVMRFVIRATIPVEAGNKMVKDPKFLQNLEDYISKTKAEASYFYESEGVRTFAFIVDLQTVDMIPSVAEPLFQRYNARVEFHPVMTLVDLKKAIKKIG
jgi:hypothetical protein